MAKGRKTGGREKGTPNKADAMTREALWAYCDEKGVNPFFYFVDVLADDTADPDYKRRCASDLLPFMMAKLKAVELSGVVGVAKLTLEQAAELSDAAIYTALQEGASLNGHTHR